MAISVDSTTNLNIIDSAEATTGWSFSGITKTAISTASREGTNCVGGQVATATHGYAYHTHTTGINMTTAGNERVYIWVKCAGAGTAAQDGWKVVIGNTGGVAARRAYTVGGSDAEPFGAKGWYCLMLDTANLPTPYSGFGSGTPDLTQIDEFGFGVYNVVPPSGNALNVFCDVVRYGSGLIVTSGATDDISLSDVASDDFDSSTGKAYGIIREIQPGVYGVQGDIIFGDGTGTNSVDWKETDAVVIYEDRVKGASTNTAFKMSGAHNSTGTFRAELGTAVSSGDDESGRSGVTFVSANPANQPINFDFSDTDIEDVFIYGCTFTNMRAGTIAFSADATNGISHHISGSTFSGCSQVDTGRTVVRNCSFAATGDLDSALLWNENNDVEYCSFLGNTTGAGIEHPSNAGSPYTHTSLNFAGNTNDVLNSSGSAITITNGGDPKSNGSSSEGSAVTFIDSVGLTIDVEDTSGTKLNDVQVYINKSASGKIWGYTSGAGNTSGGTAFVITGSPDADIPQSGWIEVLDVSDRTKQGYRYASWATSTFTFPTSVTGSATSTDGTSPTTKLISTTTNFLTADIEEGDTIKNTTTGAWAVVDEIVDADNITTTPLSSGQWTSADGFSLHTLVKTYISGTDKVDIPLLNEQTINDGSTDGNVDGSYNWGALTTPLPITVRLRSNNGATKYIPYNTSGTIISSGYTLNAVLQEDETAQ